MDPIEWKTLRYVATNTQKNVSEGLNQINQHSSKFNYLRFHEDNKSTIKYLAFSAERKNNYLPQNLKNLNRSLDEKYLSLQTLHAALSCFRRDVFSFDKKS